MFRKMTQFKKCISNILIPFLAIFLLSGLDRAHSSGSGSDFELLVGEYESSGDKNAAGFFYEKKFSSYSPWFNPELHWASVLVGNEEDQVKLDLNTKKTFPMKSDEIERMRNKFKLSNDDIGVIRQIGQADTNRQFATEAYLKLLESGDEKAAMNGMREMFREGIVQIGMIDQLRKVLGKKEEKFLVWVLDRNRRAKREFFEDMKKKRKATIENRKKGSK